MKKTVMVKSGQVRLKGYIKVPISTCLLFTIHKRFLLTVSIYMFK